MKNTVEELYVYLLKCDGKISNFHVDDGGNLCGDITFVVPITEPPKHITVQCIIPNE